MSKSKSINARLIWGILVTILLSGGLLNGGRYANNNLVETSLELLLLTSVLALIFLIWKSSTRNVATRTEKVIQLVRILFGVILLFSLSLLISDNLREHKGLILGLMISSVVSTLGLIILTFWYNILTSNEPFNNSGKDS